MKIAIQEIKNVGLMQRPPCQVMRLARMGAAHQTRLSFMRLLVRRMAEEKWRFERLRFDTDPDGYGVSVYAAHSPERTYSLVAFTQELEPEQRTDRVIAEAWDATFNLFDGVPSNADLARLKVNTPKQEAGRFTASELSVARANKSLRTFEHVVNALAAGRQPEIDFLAEVGYLMRTTAVYGSGKFGCADREKISSRPETRGAFQMEMLVVYLIRWFSIDLVEHLARSRGGEKAVTLDPTIRRFLGIGNATGLGMAPFLVSHPILINNWVMARESALAHVRAISTATSDKISTFRCVLTRLRLHLNEWVVDDKLQKSRIMTLQDEMSDFSISVASIDAFRQAWPWDKFYRLAEDKYSLEGQELIASLILEPHGDLIDYLADTMYTDQSIEFNPAMSLAELIELVEPRYNWALELNFDNCAEQRYFWYYSEDKLEPRLSDRFSEPGAEWEMPLAIGRDVVALWKALDNWDPNASAAAFVLAHPELRTIVRRVQTMQGYPYGEIYDNLIGTDVRPIDMLRFKLAFFGASKFDPKSNLWTRITMFQGAPMPDELHREDADDWAFPVKPKIVQ